MKSVTLKALLFTISVSALTFAMDNMGQNLNEQTETGSVYIYSGRSSLDLSGQGLNRLPDDVWKDPALECLYLDDNYLQLFDRDLGYLYNLKNLSLAHNNLEKLPPEIGALWQLRDFDASYNRVYRLPREIKYMVNLTVLVLSGNKLERLPDEIVGCSKLTKIFLQGNFLKRLPPRIGLCQKLEVMNLAGNKLSDLPSGPEGMGILRELQELDLSDNNFQFLPHDLRFSAYDLTIYLTNNPGYLWVTGPLRIRDPKLPHPSSVATTAKESLSKEVVQVVTPESAIAKPREIEPILYCTSITGGLKDKKEPFSLHFQSAKFSYKLTDTDGGATIALIYALCIGNTHAKMAQFQDAKGAASWWKMHEQDDHPTFNLVKPLLKMAITRFLNTDWWHAASARKALKVAKEDLGRRKAITFGNIYYIIGKWLQDNYKSLPPYEIDITPLEGGDRKGRVEGIQWGESTSSNWTPVASSLSFICLLRQLEIPTPYNEGVCDIKVQDLGAIMKAYNHRRRK